MGKEIKLSPKHGLNPTIPVCFWCGEEKNEVALLGYIRSHEKEDIEAPRNAVIDYEPCEECRRRMDMGVTLIEATHYPNDRGSAEIQEGVYPTGRYVVMKRESAGKYFGESVFKYNKAFLEPEVFEMIFE